MSIEKRQYLTAKIWHFFVNKSIFYDTACGHEKLRMSMRGIRKELDLLSKFYT